MEEQQTSTAQGNAFRDRVAALLRAARFENVTTEVRIGSKKVDICFEEAGLTQRRRIAVECKDYGRPLTKTEIATEILPEFQVLLDNRLIEGVLIVGRVALNADANDLIKVSRFFEFKTYTELQNSVMDFGSYLQAMRAQFQEQGLDEYYVRPRIEGEGDLEEHVLIWLNTPLSQPMAILAGYGMGKTSFARRIANQIAHQHAASSERRIPILIKLGELASEQDLEGLLGKVFTATSVVRNYHFALFMELNRAGRFFIILDGFDEMKHTMSWTQFKYNFAQLNRLVVPNSKVLLLGRPSAFLSDAEHNWALRGVRTIGGKELREPNWPEYAEVRIAEFTAETAYAFMDSYMRYAIRLALATGAKTVDSTTATDRLAEVRSIGFEYLIGRPVQAKMLAEIAADTTIALREFTRFELYQIFITRLIEREHDKLVRQQFSIEERRKFIRSVAWWLWNTGGSSGFAAEKLPGRLVAPFDHNDDHEAEATTRELLTGSMLEKKAGNTFYFAHRSFHEFLVAEYIAEHHWTAGDIHLVSQALTPEVRRFLEESDRTSQIAAWANLLSQPKGPLELEFLLLLAGALQRSGANPKDFVDEHSPALVLVQILAQLDGSKTGADNAWRKAIRIFSSATSARVKAAAIIGALLAAQAKQELMPILEEISALVLAEAIDELEGLLVRGHKKSVASDNLDDFTGIVIGSFKRITTVVDREIELAVDLEYMVGEMERLLGTASLTESLLLSTISVRVEALGRHADILAISQKGPIVAKFFRQYPDPTKSVIPVRVRQETRASRLPPWARPS